MKLINWFKKSRRRLTAGMLAVLLAFGPILPGIMDLIAYGFALDPNKTGNLTLHVNSYCIDDSVLVGGGLWTTSDIYQRVDPAELGADEGAMFFMTLSLKAYTVGDKDAIAVAEAMKAAGLPMPAVDEVALKQFLHSKKVRQAHAWADQAAAEAEKWLKAGGLMSNGGSSSGGSGTSVSGKTVPSDLQSHTSEGNPLDLGTPEDKTKYVYPYSGSDSAFYNAMEGHIEVNIGGTWTTNPEGWTINNTGSAIEFINNGGAAISGFRFNTVNTDYAMAGGGGVYSSPAEVYQNCLALYRCVDCSGKHPTRGNNKGPLNEHQRHVDLEVKPSPGGMYYFTFGNPDPPELDGEINFKLYVHSEDWTSHYNLRLVKYDYETGQKISGAKYQLGERFDDFDEVDTSDDGPVTIHMSAGDGSDGDGDAWNGGYENEPGWSDSSTFRIVSDSATDGDGLIEQTVTHNYHYEKTFCDGHPAPEFAVVPAPEYETDPETGEESEEAVNQDDIDAAIELNKGLAQQWLDTRDECEEKAGTREGVHFHWVMSDVDEGTIEQTASDGGEGLEDEAPDAGNTTSADGDTAYEESGCMDDCEETYDKFIDLEYSYTWKEITPKPGYVSHLSHKDDIPIEVITTNSSEGGADSRFANLYSNNVEFEEIYVAAVAEEDPDLLMMSAPKKMMMSRTAASDPDLVVTFGDSTEIEATDLFDSELEAVKEESKEEKKDIATPSNAPAIEVPEEIETEPQTETENNETEIEENKESTEGSAEGSADTTVSALDYFKSIFGPVIAYGAEMEEELIVPAEITEATPGDAEMAEPEIDEEAKEEESAEITEEGMTDGTVDNDLGHELTIIDPEAEKTEEELNFFEKVSSFFAGLLGAPSPMLGDPGEGGGGSLFGSKWYPTEEGGDSVDQGDPDNYSHCNSHDDETSEHAPTNPGTAPDNSWRVYDHRFEGEVSINKRDLNLSKADGTAVYDSYGDSNGDGTLEGAVYGLFAAENIEHPDEKSGVIYKVNELVSVATTDRDGNATFMVFTEAPGTKYDYEAGKTVSVGSTAKKNLYVGYSHDDYTADSKYTRVYPDNETDNGSCWIGRPLIRGSYYIKELSRSEGYEPSIEKADNDYTNFGQNKDICIPETEAKVTKTAAETVDATVGTSGSGDPVYETPLANEFTFEVTSNKSESGKYDLVLSDVPEGTKLYRLDSHYGPVPGGMVPSGDYEWVYKLDGGGNKIPVVAKANEYKVYVGGVPKKQIMAIDKYADQLLSISPKDYAIYADKMAAALAAKVTGVGGEDVFDQTQVTTILTTPISTVGTLVDVNVDRFVKDKVEKILRVAGIRTPKTEADYTPGPNKYTYYNFPVYNRGNVTEKVAGNPVETITVTKANMTAGDLIASILSFYEDRPYYNYGGINSITASGDTYTIELYKGSSMNVSYVGTVDGKSVIFDMVRNESTDPEQYRYVIAVYTEDGSDPSGCKAFSSYSNLQHKAFYTAKLSPQAEASFAGGVFKLTAKKAEVNVYYDEGTTPVYDKDGNIIYEGSYEPIMVPASLDKWQYHYTELAEKTSADEPWVVKVSSGSYTDYYGESHSDAASDLAVKYLVKLPGDPADLTRTLSAADEEEAKKRGSSFKEGDKLSLADYWLFVKGAHVTPYVDYSVMIPAEGSFVRMLTLKNNTNTTEPLMTCEIIGVMERPIRQQIKVVKEIDSLPLPKKVWYCANCGSENADGSTSCSFCLRERDPESSPTRIISYANDTYAAYHSENIGYDAGGNKIKIFDWLYKLLKGEEVPERATDVTDFQFKAYLLSNLERVYRDEDGTVVWLDRNGNIVTPVYEDDGTVSWKYAEAYEKKTVDFPEDDLTDADILKSENVGKVYTKVSHNAQSTTVSARANNVWNSYLTGSAVADSSEKDPYSTNENMATDKDPIMANSALYSYYGKNDNAAATDKLLDIKNAAFTRVLETTLRTKDDVNKGTVEVEEYNFEKFFDAISVADHDKWGKDLSSWSKTNYPGQNWLKTYYAEYQKDDTDTSFKPFTYIKKLMYGDRDTDYTKYPAETNGDFIEIEAKTSVIAKANAEASDMVREFATKYYLADEVAKLVKDNGLGEDIAKDQMTYDEKVYDEALYEAIAKAYDYLTPFFNDDLDAILSIRWDSAASGGKDGDYTTLSATIADDDTAETGYHYGISAYLPYGDYVVCEQAPEYLNYLLTGVTTRSYKIEKPKVYSIPTLYAGGIANKYADNYEPYYNYEKEMTAEDTAAKFLIRWAEEWKEGTGTNKHVIRAHNNNGSFEVYPYGLDFDKINQGATKLKLSDGYEYKGFSVVQSEFDPLKDVYAEDHLGMDPEGKETAIGKERGGNSLGKAAYPLESYAGNTGTTANGEKYDLDALRNRLYYGSLSENAGLITEANKTYVVRFDKTKADDNNPEGIWYDNGDVVSVTGQRTSYDGAYASMFVPYSVTTPANEAVYNNAVYTGYTDVREHNAFYSEILKLYKTDSETGELILHDDAVYGIYAASRYQTQAEIINDAELIFDAAEKARFLSQFKPGDARFYLKETEIEGSAEFLKAMGAFNIEPILDMAGNYTYKPYNTDSPLCKGTVTKGTPVCLESEQIKFTDEFGNRTGQMKVLSTKADLLSDKPEGGGIAYANQNNGIIETPQPLGAGVYVIAELKAPSGYARMKPEAIEIYWDKTQSYYHGDMYQKMTHTRETYNIITDWPYEP